MKNLNKKFEGVKEVVMSIDAESDGLWGKPFSIGAILYNKETGEELDSFKSRLSNEFVSDCWVKENVLPTLNFDITHDSLESMLKDFVDFYNKYRRMFTDDNYNCSMYTLYHMGHIVEAYLFRLMFEQKLIGMFDAPYTPIEVSEVLRLKGFNPDSVDSYAKDHSLEISDYGTTHNPLYDCEVAFKVWFDLMK